jgi:NADPH-dependent ferric siderophore reductase
MPEFDPETREHVDVLREHLNGTHADTVLLVARHLRHDVTAADLAGVDPLGAVFAVRHDGSTEDGATDPVRLDFAMQVSTAYDVRRQLLSAVGAARAAVGDAVPLTSLESELQTTATLPTVHGHLRRRRRLTPSMLEVTVGGFHDYPLRGGDEFVYVMVSPEPAGITPTYSMVDFRERVEDDPVRGAYYTVRRARPSLGEIDLWVVDHDHPGSVAAWMATAAPGAPLAFWGPRRGFEIPHAAARALLVADETGLAAVAALIEHAPPGIVLCAVLEVVVDHPLLRTVWVGRGSDAPGTVNRLLDVVRREITSDGVPDAAFGAAESHQVSAIRRVLRSEAGLPAHAVSMTGYWRRGSRG